MADSTTLITENDMYSESDEEGGDIFVPEELDEELHPIVSEKVSKVSKFKRYLCVLLLICGVLIFTGLAVMAILLGVELHILKEDQGLPPDCTTTNPYTTTMPPADMEWWKINVIYQCYPRSYQDSGSDGSGDLAGIISRVGYLEKLGVKALWLNPVFKSPQRDNGYDISNYTDIDPLFGNLEQLKQLLQELHNRGMHLLLDFVPNHTSDEHPWFIESRQDKSNLKRDWYVWADGRDNGTSPPNNWISVFGGPAWTYDNLTGQYFLHQFSEFQPDLNYSNPEVRTAFEDVLKFWLELGVDGFRIDAVAHLLEDPKLRDEPINPDNNNSTCFTDCYGYLIHNYTRNYHGIHDVIRGWRSVLDAYSTTRKRFIVGEVYESVDVVMSYYGENGDEFHFPFNFFLLVNSNWSGTEVNRLVSLWLSNMPRGGWPNWVFGNHDNHRIASKAPYYLARALNVLLLTLPGTPTTYYGEEILMTDVNVSGSARRDLYGDRDKERTPMQWTNGTNAGFTIGNPWLPLADNYTSVNVELEQRSNDSMLSLYIKLVELRSNYPAFKTTSYLPVVFTSAVLAYVRFSEVDPLRFLVVINFSNVSITVDLSGSSGFQASAQIYFSSCLDRTGLVHLSNVTLSGGEAIIFHSQLPFVPHTRTCV